jgi:predicted deacylase
MQKSIERIAGDTEGVSYEFPVFRFEGADKAAPSAYLQAALHAGELPGVVAIDALMPMLEKAEAEGRIKGDITIVPQANPIGRAQYHFISASIRAVSTWAPAPTSTAAFRCWPRRTRRSCRTPRLARPTSG